MDSGVAAEIDQKKGDSPLQIMTTKLERKIIIAYQLKRNQRETVLICPNIQMNEQMVATCRLGHWRGSLSDCSEVQTKK